MRCSTERGYATVNRLCPDIVVYWSYSLGFFDNNKNISLKSSLSGGKNICSESIIPWNKGCTGMENSISRSKRYDTLQLLFGELIYYFVVTLYLLYCFQPFGAIVLMMSDGKDNTRHHTVSLRQHGFLVLVCLSVPRRHCGCISLRLTYWHIMLLVHSETLIHSR